MFLGGAWAAGEPRLARPALRSPPESRPVHSPPAQPQSAVSCPPPCAKTALIIPVVEAGFGNVYPGSLKPNFSITDPGSKRSRIRIRIKEFKYFLSQKIVSKLSGIWSGIVHPGSGFFPIPDRDPGVQKSTGSRIRIRNIGLGPRQDSQWFFKPSSQDLRLIN
jgi:hypothetical protein